MEHYKTLHNVTLHGITWRHTTLHCTTLHSFHFFLSISSQNTVLYDTITWSTAETVFDVSNFLFFFQARISFHRHKFSQRFTDKGFRRLSSKWWRNVTRYVCRENASWFTLCNMKAHLNLVRWATFNHQYILSFVIHKLCKHLMKDQYSRFNIRKWSSLLAIFEVVPQSFFISCWWNIGSEVWSSYEDPFPSPSYDEEDDHDHDHNHGDCGGEDEHDNVTMILPSAAKILAAQNK